MNPKKIVAECWMIIDAMRAHPNDFQGWKVNPSLIIKFEKREIFCMEEYR